VHGQRHQTLFPDDQGYFDESAHLCAQRFNDVGGTLRSFTHANPIHP
jgi:hypothetical protein